MRDYRTFYEAKALEYPDFDRPARVRYEKAIGFAELKGGERVLDIACKDADLLRVLRSRGLDVDYTGLDLSERVIEKAKGLGRGGAVVVADLLEGAPVPDGSFDRIFALEILEHLPQPLRLLEEARRLLKDDGRLLLSVPNPYYYMELVNEVRHFPDQDGHLFSFTDANLRAFLTYAGFEVEGAVGTYFLIPRRLRGAFRNHDYFILKRVPNLFACSRVYRVRKA